MKRLGAATGLSDSISSRQMFVSLDGALKTMRRPWRDMSS
jgi:hypothetical protein